MAPGRDGLQVKKEHLMPFSMVVNTESVDPKFSVP